MASDSKLVEVQLQVTELTGIMHENVNQVMKNQENLAHLESKSEKYITFFKFTHVYSF
jgi:hypothetical protein